MSHTSSPSTPLPPSARPSAAEEDPDPWGTNSPSTSPKLPLSSGLGPRRLFADDDDAGFGSKPEGQKGSNVHDGVDEDGDGDGDDELPDWTKELSSGGGMRGLSSPTALNSGRNGGDPDGFERTGWTPDEDATQESSTSYLNGHPTPTPTTSNTQDTQNTQQSQTPANTSPPPSMPNTNTEPSSNTNDNINPNDDNEGFNDFPTSPTPTSAMISSEPTNTEDAFDDNDDFDDFGDFDDTPALDTGEGFDFPSVSASGDGVGEGGFGGGFGEGEGFGDGDGGRGGGGDDGWGDERPGYGTSSRVTVDAPKSLHLTPTSLPPKPLLISQIKSLLAPAFPILSEPSPNAVASGSGGGGGLGLGDDDDDDGDGGGGGEAARLREYREKYLTDEPRREVEGLGQILFVEGSRDLYTQFVTPPVLKPLEWKRSRVRREQLISLGVPVNLDEVDSHRLSTLPPLRITTTNNNNSSGQGRSSVSRERNGGAREREKKLGPKPGLNRERCGRLLEYREDQLGLVPPKYLARMQGDLVQACSEAAALLAWLKQEQEIRGEENKRKNDEIARLISAAQKQKAAEAAASSGGGLFRKGSVKKGSTGGSRPPSRVGSPVFGR